jgi:predicted transposase YdaD
MQLTIAPEAETATRARALIERVRAGETGILAGEEIIEVVAAIAVYKLADKSREEVEEMLGLKLEETRIYRELRAEITAEMLAATVPVLLKTGMTVEQIAEQLKVDTEAVRRTVVENT